MNIGRFAFEQLLLSPVEAPDVPVVQSILDHAAYYHTTIVQYSPAGMAQRCFDAPPPEVKNSRVFKRFLLVQDQTRNNMPVAAVDLFVGYPNYKIASIAMCVVREDCQRKGIGTRLLTGALPAFLREFHPAVETISVSLTDNNVPALRCLLKCAYSRTDCWEKLDIKGRPIIALTYRRNISDILDK